MTDGRFGPFALAPGVTARHMVAYLYATFVSIGFFTYLATLTPYILEVNLGIPRAQHGAVAGDLQFVQELLVLLVAGLWGALSDRAGRRPVYVATFGLLALAYVLYPLAGSLAGLTAARLVFGAAVAGLSAMLVTVAADYATDASRGKLTGFTFLLNGIGAVLFFAVLSKLPGWFAAAGYPPVAAGRYAYWLVAGLALFSALVATGLRPGRPAGVSGRPPLTRVLRDGLRAARNPRIAVAYVGGFAARADLAVISLFLTLWGVQAATAAGASPAEAAGRAGLLVGIALTASMLWSPLLGIVADRIDRLTLLAAGFALGALGYGWVASVADPLAASSIPALLLLGVGQSSTVLSSTVLLAEEAPAPVRGAAFGVQNFCGTVGILALSAVGGRLFDSVGPHVPLVLAATANGAVAVLALALLVRGRRAAVRD